MATVYGTKFFKSIDVMCPRNSKKTKTEPP